MTGRPSKEEACADDPWRPVAVALGLGRSDQVPSGQAQSEQPWRVRRHLDPERGNLVRAVARRAGGERALHVNAELGVVTEVLAELGYKVDALTGEAEIALLSERLARCGPGHRVFPGLSSIADPSTYSLILIDDLGDPRLNPHEAFSLDLLKDVTERLAPGGAIVACMTNPVGVTYLTGTADPTTGRFFDGLEGYPHLPDRSVMGRELLERRLSDLGLETDTLLVFPDHEMARAVLSPGALEFAPELLHEIPRFSRELDGSERSPIASEYHVWRNLVELGLARDFSNSHVIIGRRPGDSALWPDVLAARYLSTSVAPEFQIATDVVNVSGVVEFRPRHLFSQQDIVRMGPIEHRAVADEYRPGESLVDVLARALCPESLEYLARWVDLLDAAILQSPGFAPMDLVPHNLNVDGFGNVVQFDNDWFSAANDRTDVIRRGIFWLAVRLGQRAAPEALSPSGSVEELAKRLGGVVGLGDGDWLAEFYAVEARFQLLTKGQGVVDTDQLAPVVESLRGFGLAQFCDAPLAYHLNDVIQEKMAENAATHVRLASAEAYAAGARDLMLAKDRQIENQATVIDQFGLTGDEVARIQNSPRALRVVQRGLRNLAGVQNFVTRLRAGRRQ